MSDTDSYVIACRTTWFWDIWQKPGIGTWHYIKQPSELNRELLESIDPRTIFFPHWSERVSAEIVSAFECVCFHATPLPYGRGGSPVQNMIAHGHEETTVTAFRMTDELDAGPVYDQRSMSLLGGGDEIYMRLSSIVAGMITDFVHDRPEPNEQSGEPLTFQRRRPEQSRLPEDCTLKELFDFIRMLDAEGYPSAYADFGEFRIEFERPALRRGEIRADVSIRKLHDH